MIQLILIDNNNGRVLGSLRPHSDHWKEDGQVESGILYKKIGYHDDPEPYMSKYWNGSRFLPLPTQPGPQWEWDGSKWVRNVAALEAEFKKERNKRLRESDWTMLEDAPVDKGRWRAYRAALRGLAVGNAIGLDSIPWPEKP